ncbi:hypothetical protein JCGZ_11026 [Jatropha curcas]|uniref:Uncharacterized protein n=1 Tax=Jatropha curcas TaxID=180498 RepID=A0A067KTA7_JATCU|nr:hypothetical protein JCGZ_11026 [Jatropha curcas]
MVIVDSKKLGFFRLVAGEGQAMACFCMSKQNDGDDDDDDDDGGADVAPAA